jgi:hypothetical protein
MTSDGAPGAAQNSVQKQRSWGSQSERAGAVPALNEEPLKAG